MPYHVLFENILQIYKNVDFRFVFSTFLSLHLSMLESAEVLFALYSR